jgi:hypothetical protein
MYSVIPCRSTEVVEDQIAKLLRDAPNAGAGAARRRQS